MKLPTLSEMPRTDLGNPYFGMGVYMYRWCCGWLVMYDNKSQWIRSTRDAIKFGYEKLGEIK